jgi:4-amino-4-deoxy-L-arabinose transferase-like glycosyltransferase
MTTGIQLAAKNLVDGITTTYVASSTNKPSRSWIVDCAAVFAVALLVRLFYNFNVLEHRLCHFADGYFFLTSGSLILKWLESPQMLWNFLTHFDASILSTQTGINAAISERLTNRLLIDGPVYPTYLALVEAVSGVNPLDPRFDVAFRGISICNSILDSLSCVLVYVCGRLSFSRVTGIIAGALMTLYPAAVLGTALCYSEPLSYFLLLAWMASLLCSAKLAAQNSRRFGLLAAAGAGFLSALTMLCKPSFVIVPPVVLGVCAIAAVLRADIRSLFTRSQIAAFAIALGLTFLPWLTFTSLATGKPILFVNRVPAFNFFIGNDISNDGWRTYPLPYIPATVDEAVSLISQQAGADPVAFALFEARKLPRLFAGAWNPFEYTFIFTASQQDTLQQMILFMGLLGAMLALSARNRRTVLPLVTKLTTTAFLVMVCCHFAYLGFEPLSRYSVTVTPFMLILSAYALFVIFGNAQRRRFTGLLLIPVGLAACIGQSMMSLHSELWWLSLLTWSSVAIVIALYCRSVRGSLTVPSLITLVCATLAVSVSAVAHSLTNPRGPETAFSLDGQSVEQQIALPPPEVNPATRQAFLLLDVRSDLLEPNIKISVNDVQVDSKPVPWLQIEHPQDSSVGVARLQGRQMGRNLQQMRQWWAIALPDSVLRWGHDNAIKVTSTAPKEFGQFLYADPSFNSQTTHFPSLWKTSWTKGFATIARGDMRLSESQPLLSGTSRSYLNGGEQSSQWRIRIASCALAKQAPPLVVPVDTSRKHQGKQVAIAAAMPEEQSLTDSTVRLIPADQEMLIDGAVPTSCVLPTVSLTEQIKGAKSARFRFSCLLRKVSKSRGAFVANTFAGTGKNGHRIQWQSEWEPLNVNPRSAVTPVAFSDRLPAELVQAPDLTVTTFVSPFQTDLLFLRRKEAIKSKVAIKNATMSFEVPEQLPPVAKRDWKIY